MGSIMMVVVVLGVGFWLALRARNSLKRQQEDAAEREKAFLATLASAPSEPSPIGGSGEGLARGPAVRQTALASPIPQQGVSYLSTEAGLVFRMLKSACPADEVFPRGSLRRILGPAALGKDIRVDFVVCTPDFKPKAVVDIARPDDLPAVIALKKERLAAAGVSYGRWDPAALPGVEELGAFLSGANSSPPDPSA